MMKSACSLLLLWVPVVLGQVMGQLNDLATVIDRSSHRASSHDPSGGNNDSLVSLTPGATHVMLDTDGPGKITHLWFTVAGFSNHYTFMRDLVLRMYWEDSPVPSVEVPLADFFAMGHGKRYPVQSVPVAVGINTKALNCYWPMPFHKHARIEIYNNGQRSLRRLYYNIDYELGPLPPDQGLFHAVFHRQRELRTQEHAGNTTGADNYVILETTGRGHYVGCALFVDAQPGGWWGEGDDMIFIDHSPKPVIIGTGSEDYFCNAWGYETAFSYPFYGAPLLESRPDKGQWTSVYRWHINDPVRFKEHIKVTIEHLFGSKVVNDYSSVAYWYQTGPIKQRDPLPAGEQNHPRVYAPASQPAPATFELDGTELEAGLRQRGIAARGITANLHEGFEGGGYLAVETGGKMVEIVIPVPQDGRYRVAVKPVNQLIEGRITLALKGTEPKPFGRRDARQGDIPHVDLGTAASKDKTLTLIVGGNPTVGIDHLRIERVAD